MIKLGLIGGIGPESTISYYKAITAGYYQQTGNFPRLSIESLSVFDVLRLVDRGDKAALANYILKEIRDLENGGAQVAALTGITPHVVIERIRELSSIPIVSLLDTTEMAIQELGAHNVLLLGTKQTMQDGFFARYLMEHGIRVTIPDAEEIDYIGQKIETELELGIVRNSTKGQIKGIVERIIGKYHSDLVVLGCTELPLIFNQLSLPVRTLDVTENHIQKLISMIVNS